MIKRHLLIHIATLARVANSSSYLSQSDTLFTLFFPKALLSLSEYFDRMPPTQTPLSTLLPSLICGTATFNSQYNPDPYKLPTTEIVHRALSLGVRAFDTSPYYGPAEVRRPFVQ